MPAACIQAATCRLVATVRTAELAPGELTRELAKGGKFVETPQQGRAVGAGIGSQPLGHRLEGRAAGSGCRAEEFPFASSTCDC